MQVIAVNLNSRNSLFMDAIRYRKAKAVESPAGVLAGKEADVSAFQRFFDGAGYEETLCLNRSFRDDTVFAAAAFA